MTVPVFDAFVAIDWSGARGSYKGISVARCSRGSGAPRLVIPKGRYWTRREIADWLAAELEKDQRLLIGFDFAFSFPFEENLGYFGGRAARTKDIFSLWDFIEERCGDEADFGCANFVKHPDLAPLFWTEGPRPHAWIERKRSVEFVCAEFTKTWPETLYKLLHSKQVGKASITGIRVLNAVRKRVFDHVAVWPFEAVNKSAFVEIYPTIFRKLATRSTAKLKTKSQLDGALAHFSSKPMPGGSDATLSDHDTDALISAAGLRVLAATAESWAPRDIAQTRIQREGWIFGVGQGRTLS